MHGLESGAMKRFTDRWSGGSRTTLVGAGLLSLLCGGCSEPQTGDPEAELVCIVIVDTLRRDALGSYGHENAGTPRMDALAAEGVRFDQAISSSGWTLPSVASLLTGTWPSLHKALGKVSLLTPITDDLPVAAEVYRDAGYRTLGFANAAYLSPLLGLDRGFEVFDHEHAYNWDIRRADATVDAALAEVSAREGEKIFLLVHLFDAHLDYDPPDGYLASFVGDRRSPEPPLSMKECVGLQREDGQAPPSEEDLAYIRGLYQGEVSSIDLAIGRLVDGLVELERWDYTTLVLTSDHGEEFWDHGGFEHGHTLYDELVRVPLILRTPTTAASDLRVIERQVRTIDIMPTLFELSGVEEPTSFEGLSLLSDLGGTTPAYIPAAFSQGTLYGAEKMSWRTERYHLIVDQALQGADAIELYDIVEDPLETRELSGERPKVTAQLSKDLARFSRDLELRATTISTPELKNMGPSTIKKYLESLDKLGYTGRDDDGVGGQ
jgi:arylsulfatase A-like enzyme